jgi:hypothetical protein
MLASEAITNLSATELKQLSVRSDNAAMLIYLNEAVEELHKEFNLWQDEAIITYALGTTRYVLDGVDANVTIDLSDKKLLLITDAYDYDGTDMGVNDEDDLYGIVTPQYNVVEFPPDYEEDDTDLTAGAEFSILYRAAPIDMTDVSDTIVLPPTLTQCMYRYAAFRAYASQNNKGETESNVHFKRYQFEVDRVKKLGLISPESMHGHQFSEGNYPWV